MVLGLELVSLVKAASALGCRAISPALVFMYLMCLCLCVSLDVYTRDSEDNLVELALSLYLVDPGD